MKRITSLVILLGILTGCNLLNGETTMMEDPQMPDPMMPDPMMPDPMMPDSLTLAGTTGNVTIDSAPCSDSDYEYQASGGVPPYQYSFSAPMELNAVAELDMAGAYKVSVNVGGVVGSWAMTVSVTDSAGNTAEKMVVFSNMTSFIVTVTGDALVETMSPASLVATASMNSASNTTRFNWTVQSSPMGSSSAPGTMLMGTINAEKSNLEFTPDVSGEYVLDVEATQGSCRASSSFTLEAREDCTSSVTLVTMPTKVQVGQQTVVSATYDDPSGNETYQWRWTKPNGTQEALMVETFENQSGVVYGANAYLTPMTRGSHSLEFIVIDGLCQYSDTVELEAAQQRFILDAPRTTYLIDSSGQDWIETRLQYGDADSLNTDLSDFGGLPGVKTNLTLEFPEENIEIASNCSSASGMTCEWWDSRGPAMGNLTPVSPSFDGVLFTTGGGISGILSQVAPSTRTVPTIFINDARPMPLIATATKTFHFRHRQEVPFALYNSTNNQLYPGEAAISEGDTIRLEITAGYFNAPLTFEVTSNNPLITLSASTIVFPARSEGMTKSITLTAAQDMDVDDSAAVINIREMNNAGFGDLVTGDYASYTPVSTQIHIRDDDRMSSCPMLATTSCWAEYMVPANGAFYCDNLYRDRLAVNVTGGSGDYQFYFHQSDRQSFENLEGPLIPSYVDSVVGLSMSPEGAVSEWVACQTGSISRDPEDDIKRCEWDVVVVDKTTGCAIRHYASGTSLN
ncbi:MAG: hypothetical protein VYC39_09000 [Myxococcota bacterium]|nr:hypothetical protein [Myxococcota bacterium]